MHKIFHLLLFALLLSSIGCKPDTPPDKEPGAPTIEFAVSNVTVDLSDTLSPSPELHASIQSEVGLRSVKLYRVEGELRKLVQEINSFPDVHNYPATYQPVYDKALTGWRIVATDISKRSHQAEMRIVVISPNDTTTDPPMDTTVTPPPSALRLAFPTAEGCGRETWGGRGGRVYVVDKLSDDGSVGTLRHAVSQRGCRTIVFAVSGTIALTSPLKIDNDSITIAGQSAPGDGICLRDNAVVINANQVIVRYMRFRMGDATQVENDAFWGRQKKNIIVDHCSMSWSTDECSSFYNNAHFTMQWCLIAESLRVSIHGKGTHGYGGIWGGHLATFHHNLIAHHDSRNPRFNGARLAGADASKESVDFANNVIYNWGSNNAYGGESARINIRNNYYKPGPASGSSSKNRFMEAYCSMDGTTFVDYGQFHLSGNVMEGNATISADNWRGLTMKNGGGSSQKTFSDIQSAQAFPFSEIQLESAQNAYENVLLKAGASLHRDAVDSRIVGNVRQGNFSFPGSQGSKNGLIDSQNDVGGWPQLNSKTAPRDSDNDGMPDEWENTNGLDPYTNDSHLYNLHNDYTNLEYYLNFLTDENPSLLSTLL